MTDQFSILKLVTKRLDAAGINSATFASSS